MATSLLGNFQKDATVSYWWSTNDGAGASITRSTDGVIRIYKGTSLTQRTSTSGIVDTEDADDPLTGCHLLTIDTSDNTDAGFYEDGEIYHVVLVGAVVDTQTVNEPLCSFVIGQMVGATSTVLSNASSVAIANRALIMLGEKVIASLTEDSRAAALVNTIFAGVRDSVLESHTWKSARKRVALAQLSTSPAFGFANEFQMPSDFIRAVQVMDEDVIRHRYQIEGRKFLTDDSSVNLEYVARITDPNDMSPMLQDSISVALAIELALPLTGKRSVRDEMRDAFDRIISNARHSDASQRNDDVMSTEVFDQARDGGIGYYRPLP